MPLPPGPRVGGGIDMRGSIGFWGRGARGAPQQTVALGTPDWRPSVHCSLPGASMPCRRTQEGPSPAAPPPEEVRSGSAFQWRN